MLVARDLPHGVDGAVKAQALAGLRRVVLILHAPLPPRACGGCFPAGWGGGGSTSLHTPSGGNGGSGVPISQAEM